MLALYRRGRVFWARGSVRGLRVRKSLDTQFKEEATLRIQELERELYTGKRVRPLGWTDFADEYMKWKSAHLSANSVKKYDFTLTRFSLFAAGRPVQWVTRKVLGDYVAERRADLHPTRKKLIGNSGIAADLRILHGAFAYAVRQGYLESNPVEFPRDARTSQTQPFSRDEVDRMLKACDVIPERGGPPYPLKAVVLTFLHTGLRIGDVVGLKKTEVDFGRREITVMSRKRGKSVTIPMHEDLVAALKEHIKGGNFAQHASPLVFSTSEGKAITSLAAYLQRLYKRAGIVGGHAHKFRDSYAVGLLQNGASLYDLAKLLGTTVTVAERHYAPYTKELQERGRRLVESLDFAKAKLS